MRVNDLVVVHNEEPVGIVTKRKRKNHKWVYTYRHLSDGKVIVSEDHLLNAQFVRSKMTWDLLNMHYNIIEKRTIGSAEIGKTFKIK